MKNYPSDRNGFTLLELILVFVLFSIFAAMILPYFWSGAMSSETPINRLTNDSILSEAMELVISDYYYLSPKNSTNLTDATNSSSLVCKLAGCNGGNVSNDSTVFATNYSTRCPLCSNCSASANPDYTALSGYTNVGTNALLVTITCTNPSTGNKESMTNVFTVQSY